MIRIVEERVENFIGTWIVNIEEVTLEGLKNSICEMNLKLPALENDGVVLNFTYEVLTSERSRLQQNALAVHIEEQFQVNYCYRDPFKSFLRLVISKSMSALRTW
ncbi:hypothetical protein GLOIN_2v811958 [Rhizophagus irregularis DAOM 181602=DAOM 197198]|nr:hypothetical protein GLOIN_2v811958 [Rhizophagus irregularis DAOM 181602=DAOM 197198]